MAEQQVWGRDRDIDAHLRIAGAVDSENDSYLNLLQETITERLGKRSAKYPAWLANNR